MAKNHWHANLCLSQIETATVLLAAIILACDIMQLPVAVGDVDTTAILAGATVSHAQRPYRYRTCGDMNRATLHRQRYTKQNLNARNPRSIPNSASLLAADMFESVIAVSLSATLPPLRVALQPCRVT